MVERLRQNTRMLVALGGIAAFCTIAIFIAIAILIVRDDVQNTDSSVGIPVQVGEQVVVIYPYPAMVVNVVSEQPGASSPDDTGGDGTGADGTGGQPDAAEPTTPAGTGDQAQPTADTQAPVATYPPPTPTFPPPTPVPPSVVVIPYVVVPGDNLYRITQKHNTSIDLMATYDIAATDMIVGNSFMLPVANPAFCPGIRAHVVRDQQTVSEIARAYNTTPQAIGAANGLDANYSVKTTQVLCVPY